MKEESKNEIKENIPPKQEIKKEVVPIEKKEEPKIDTTVNKNQALESENAAKIKADSIAAAKKQEDEFLRQEAMRKQDSIDKAKIESVNTIEYKKSVVKLKSESSTTAGIGLVFIDMLSEDKADTIRILIPAEIKKEATGRCKTRRKKVFGYSSG